MINEQDTSPEEQPLIRMRAITKVFYTDEIETHALSGGQQQRVAVARALAGSPSILLADEPTGNLDSKNGEAVMDMLRKLHAEGTTICMVTHDARYADFAERRVQLFDGRILFEDRVRPVVTHDLAPAV